MKRILYTLLLCFAGGYVSAQCTPVIHTSDNHHFICDGGTSYIHSTPASTYQWYLDGTVIANATSQYYAASIPGSYTVEVDSAGCVATSAAMVLTPNNSPDIPGTITGDQFLCEGSAYTFSIDPVPGADRYQWSTDMPYWGIPWEGLIDDSTNIATTGAGPSTTGTDPFAVLKVAAINACGTTYATKNIEVYSPVREYGYGISPDVLGFGMMPFCPARPGSIRVEVSRGEYTFGYMSPYTLQWYLDNVALPGETDKYLELHRGGDYSVQVMTDHCGTFTVQKHVHQNVPGIATITPQGPLSYCSNNVQPLTVAFDMTGVDGPSFRWGWCNGPNGQPIVANVYSIMPDSIRSYLVRAWDDIYGSGYCDIIYPGTYLITVPPTLEVTQLDDTLFATPGYDSYQWYESGVLLPGETQQQLTLTYDGLYTVEGVFMNGCVENSASFDPLFMPPPPPPPGTNITPGDEMTISPNPVSGSFVLFAKTAKEDETADICITDAMGKILFEKKVPVVDGVVKEKIDLPDGVNFIGFLKLRSKSTGKTMRFNKQ